MGYSAVADGMIFLEETDRKKTDEIAGYIRDNIAEFTDICEGDDTEGNTCISFIGSSREYDCETYRALYRMLDERCLEGHIDFRGEDGALWCHHYHEDRAEWNEHRGKVVYEGLDA